MLPKRIFARGRRVRSDQFDRYVTRRKQRGMTAAQATAAVVLDVQDQLADRTPSRRVQAMRYLEAVTAKGG